MTINAQSAASLPPGIVPNAQADLQQRARAAQLAWLGPLAVLLARTVLAFGAQALIAAIYAARGTPEPWRAAAPWFTVTGTLVDLGSLALMAWFARREGLRLRDLLGPGQAPLGRDLLIAAGLIPLLMLAGIGVGALTAALAYGPGAAAQNPMGPLPGWAAWYSALIWPIPWALAEQMTYQGYALPRLQVLTGRTWAALALTALAYGLQHLALPFRADAPFLLTRVVPAAAAGLVMGLVYLRLRRLRPLIFAHWFIDCLSAVIFVPLPLL